MSSEPNTSNTNEARRQFLARCGKFAVITPPLVGLMLSATRSNYALAASGLGGFIQENGSGNGNGGHNNTGRRRGGTAFGRFLRKLF